MDKKVKKTLSISITIICIIAFLVLACVATFKIVYITTTVHGVSMYPTLNSNSSIDGDNICINKFEKGKVGDIIVVNVTKEPNWDHSLEGDYVIKRLIGQSGDRIKIEQNGTTYNLLVNGEVLYTKEYDFTPSTYQNYMTYLSNNVSNGDLVENDEIIVSEGKVFIAGDNWLNTYDCFDAGCVSKSSIVGRVDVIVPSNKNFTWGIIKGIIKNIF